MKYEKTDELDRLITQAIEQAEDSETAEFLAAGAADIEISEELDRRILGFIEKKSAFKDKFCPRLLSSAALVAFVSICFMWVAMMSTFVKFPWNGTEPPTDVQTSGSPLPPESYISQQLGTDTESTKPTGHSGRQTEGVGPNHAIESTNRENDPPFVSSSDEQRVFYIFRQTSADGIFMQISVAGYQSESLGKEFYVKSNEYFTVDVTVKNTSSTTYYRTAYTDCSEGAVPHSHEEGLELSYKGSGLCASTVGFSCGNATSMVELKPGETYTYQLKYAAGTETASGFDLPGDGNDHPAGVKLYDELFYHFYDKGSCTFDGHFEFVYCTRINGGSTSFWIPLSLEVVYVA